MLMAVIAFAQSTISLLLFTTLGVFGAIDSVQVHEYGLSVEKSAGPYFAVGGIAYHGGGERQRAHELGHLRHEDELGVLYLPIAGLTSLFGNIGVVFGWMDAEDYYGMWTERTADEYGGVVR